MNKLFLMRNPELFQGQKYLKKNHHYFEGWYFKNTNYKESISFIPGICIDSENKEAFIQVITDETSYYISYDIHEFQFCFNPFSIKIGNNIFSKDGIYIDINDKKQNLKIRGNLRYLDNKNIHTSVFWPNIMGPFSYIPFMECNHAILSMRNRIHGVIQVNRHKIRFHDGCGYIEKDWGSSFPKAYVWCQGNCFKKSNASFMLSVAHVPFSFLSFQGFICVLLIQGREFQFTTYNGAKIVRYHVDDTSLHITLKKGIYTLDVKSKLNSGLKLSAPVRGKMERDIFESITGKITVCLKKNGKIIYSDTSTNCGVEIGNT